MLEDEMMEIAIQAAEDPLPALAALVGGTIVPVDSATQNYAPIVAPMKVNDPASLAPQPG
jgi:hypothetical protein